MKKVLVFLFSIVGIVALASPSFAAQAFKVDRAHSTIGFTVTHLMVSKVVGQFPDFEDDVAFSKDDLAGSKFNFKIKPASVDTRNAQRDKHLQSPDFFDVEKYPLITFTSKKIAASADGSYIVTGDLTMKDVTKEIQIPVKVLGPIANPMGKGQILGVESNFTINRQDYGINWNKVLDQGGVAVSNEVAITISIEADQK